MYFRTFSAFTSEVNRQGLDLQVEEGDRERAEYFFEVKLPPWVWRHVCFVYKDDQRKVGGPGYVWVVAFVCVRERGNDGFLETVFTCLFLTIIWILFYICDIW